jgi:tRNA (cytidine/uridine-2'-O-)-methyltransferase
MFDVILHEPEIPPNTGNLIRLAANTGARLHLVKPLGFRLNDKALARAGLDYHDLASVTVHQDWQACCEHFAATRMFAFTTRAERYYSEVTYRPGDALLFGAETRGLPEAVLAAIAPPERLKLPMRGASRSLNLANAVAVVVYEAWRQLAFAGAR